MRHVRIQREGFVDFSESSTTHGFYYAFERDVRSFSRLFWLLTCVGFFCLSVYLIAVQHRAWKADPVLTSVGTTGYPVTELEFPAITICGLGISGEVLNGAYE